MGNNNKGGKYVEPTRKKCRVTRFINQPTCLIASKMTPINSYPSQDQFLQATKQSINHFHVGENNNAIKHAYSSSSISSGSLKMNKYAGKLGFDWQANMSNIYETLQYEKSKSFRRTNTNNKMLFEEITKTFMIGLQRQQELQMQSTSRKNSTQHSSMSMRSGDRRQSISVKPIKKTRSQSIISNQ